MNFWTLLWTCSSGKRLCRHPGRGAARGCVRVRCFCFPSKETRLFKGSREGKETFQAELASGTTVRAAAGRCANYLVGPRQPPARWHHQADDERGANFPELAAHHQTGDRPGPDISGSLTRQTALSSPDPPSGVRAVMP
jgi:hypothetical protein